MGYYRAGFEVVGFDVEDQPRYPFEFHKMDALQAIREFADIFDAFHASPPCQRYSRLKGLSTKKYPKLIVPVRKLLMRTKKPFVIENVPGAPLRNPLMLCGTMFGLPLIRHRLFEVNPPIYFAPATCQCRKLFTNAFHGYSAFRNGAQAISCVGNNFDRKDGSIAQDIDWMNRRELAEAIPPAYTEFIGGYLLKHALPTAMETGC
jgi:DNA (cytosine-5)-methyltransferase 1